MIGKYILKALWVKYEVREVLITDAKRETKRETKIQRNIGDNTADIGN